MKIILYVFTGVRGDLIGKLDRRNSRGKLPRKESPSI